MEHLAGDERAKLFERFGRTYGAGEAVYSDGEAADSCFLVQSGRVRLVKHIRTTERSLTILNPGDLFGEDALLPKAVRTASAVALTELKVLALSRTTFATLLSGKAEVAIRLVEQLVRRLRDAEEQLENTMLRDNPSRVVNTLVRLASAQEEGPEGHVLSVSPLELSSRVGIDVDAVKRVVQQLREAGYLRIADERIMIPSLEPLRRLYHLLGMKEEVRGGFL